MAGIDPTLYGGVQMPPELAVQMPAGSIDSEQYQAPTPVPAAQAVEGTPTAIQGESAAVAAAAPQASKIATVGAAMTDWSVGRVLRYASKPTFEPEGPEVYDPAIRLRQVPMMLSDDEREFLLQSRSNAEWDWAMRQLENTRDIQKAVSDNPVTGMIATALDAGYIAADMATMGAARIAQLGRLKTALTAAGSAGAVSAGVGYATSQVQPVSSTELMLDVLLNTAATGAGAAIGMPTGRTPALPTEAMQSAVRRAAKMEPVPDPAKAAYDYVENWNGNAPTSLKEKVARKIMWNVHQSLSEFNPNAANKLVDNNLDLSKNSVESYKRAVRADMEHLQYQFEDLLVAEMGDRKGGWFRQVFDTQSAVKTQNEIERELAFEMFKRERAYLQGVQPTPATNPRIQAMADKLDELAARSLQEMKAAGVAGAEEITNRTGWFSRNWDAAKHHGLQEAIMASGKTAKEADKMIKGMIAAGLRRANPDWSKELAGDISSAIIDRVKRKGLGDDPLFYTHQGSAVAKQIRDMLEASSLPAERIQKVLDVLVGQVDETGKPKYLKHRVDIDYKSGIVVNGKTYTVADLIDTNVATITDRYLDSVSGQVAFAKVGLNSESAINRMRDEFAQGVLNPYKRKEALELFDNVVNHLQGKPTGEKLSTVMRNMNAWTRLVGLANSGILQLTEYATMAAHYGLLKTFKYATSNLPVFREVLGEAAKNPQMGTRLKDVLSRAAFQETRLRPFLNRFEDGFAIPPDAVWSLKLQQAQQAIPYLNGMKWIQRHQANTAANLILDRMSLAANGNPKAIKALEKYGIKPGVMVELRRNFSQFGQSVDKWDDGLWEAVRPAFIKMMDESVLKARLGDVPAFAAFDKLGKFVFTFRSFTLTAHNKVLAGTLARESPAVLPLLMMYQFPLAVAAVHAVNASQGKPPLKDEDAVKRAIGQMGGLGLFTELFGILSGDKQQWGAPGMIAADRAYKVLSQVGQGDGSKAASAFLGVLPLVAITPGTKAIQEHLK